MLVCRRSGQIRILAVLALLTSPLRAQSTLPQTGPASPSIETRPATTTATGDTGLWFVPTGDVLPAGSWSLSAYYVNVDYQQGFTDVSTWPVTFAAGLGRRVEIFGAWSLVTRIDRDVRPLFSSNTAGTASNPGGVVNEFPFVSHGWSGSHLGDLRIGGKIDLTSHRAPTAFALRALVKLPLAGRTDGTGTGKLDAAFDAILSREIIRRFEVTGFAGFIARGDPDAFDLTNGVRWGTGVAISTRARVQLTAEVHGEQYLDADVMFHTSPATIAEPFPILSHQKSPLYASLAMTWIGSRGVFVGAGINWNFNIRARSDFGPFSDRTGDFSGLQIRIGYHRGVRTRPPAPSTTGTIAARSAAASAGR